MFFCRPPGIFREHYLIELFRRYGELNNVSSLPPLPAWLTTSQIDDTNNNNISNNCMKQVFWLLAIIFVYNFKQINYVLLQSSSSL